MEEFEEIAKNELELLSLAEALGDSDTAESKKAAAAVKGGVRVNRTQSTQHDLRMQGDASMLTQEAMDEPLD